MELLDFTRLTALQWALSLLTGLVVGMSKTGVAGVNLAFVPLMASAFGGKPSTGIILPMLNVGDIFGVASYHQHADRRQLVHLLPWTFAGLLLGVWVGASMTDGDFKKLLAVIVFVCLALMFWLDSQKKEFPLPRGTWFPALAGLAAGFTTMVGNAAGPVMTIYLLAMRLSKNTFIGTSAWFFLIVNLTKLPLQIFFWKNIDGSTLLFDAAMIPAIIGGAFVGLIIVRRLPEKVYRVFLYVVTVLSALMLLF